VAQDDRYRIVHIAEAESVGEGDVLALWEREGAMPAEVARRRVGEVAFVGLEEREGLVAVSSLYLQRSQRLGMDLWHYRAFVARAHRRSMLAEELTVAMTSYLEERFVSGLDRSGAGVLMEIENQMLKTVKNEAIWPQTRLAFIGEDARGNHLRVRYFPGALVPVA
jgi:hypothetical protein